ncbi:cytochrome c oxidase assembly protein [Deinococcus deserti]|uniref:Cytochrome c oxidase assembly protein n=1 Tax=Deinococcus deserti (strain DSM 17065 / CIP 109153 / LMG 22923 / VCD115) TaxID=546414 RepID=C1D3Y6_DEIDV|nr:cytochrome c oxidase assembly protein [Deinococcus deserti]ACO48215.1 conserved hypothetical protein; putative membrane protein [Deinococcus deserti VCD115]
MHSRHSLTTDPEVFSLLGWGLLLILGALYLMMAARQRRKRQSWPVHRTASFILGLALLAWAFSPLQNALAHTSVRAHMRQHLVSGMFAPLALALGWPLTLLLRSLPVSSARRLIRWLHWPSMGLLTSPGSVLVLNVGGLYLLYLTPLYSHMLGSALLHTVVACHVVAAGFLYAVVLSGIEPVAVRTSFRARLVVLLLGTAAHAILAKVLYAGLWPRGTTDSPENLRAAAQLMYSWGDLAEVLLMGVAFWGWFQTQRRSQRRARPEAELPVEEGNTAWIR